MKESRLSLRHPVGRQVTVGAKDPNRGYILIFLLIIIFAMIVGLLVAVPVLETQIKREKEEELIFRGRQYVEAIRQYQQKRPGSFPQSLEELIKKNACAGYTVIRCQIAASGICCLFHLLPLHR